jgi:hypothetical protein
MAWVPNQHYRIISADTSDQLECKVNELLKDQWRVSGGITIASIGRSPRFYQAVVKDTHSFCV